MSDGRTIWWPKDAAWWRRERIVELGEEFGSAGPAVIDWLSCEAKAQNQSGAVKSGVRSCARGCFVDIDTVRHVLSRSVTLSLLHDLEEREGVFTCRISGWREDDARGRAAVRKANQRARETAESPAPEPKPPTGQTVTSHGLSHPVTPSHAEFHTEENRKAEEAGSAGATGATITGLHPQLGEVVQILEGCRAPDGRGLLVEPASINSMILAHPDRDPVRAAHKTAAIVQAGNNRSSNATSLFGSVIGAMKPEPADTVPARDERRARRHAAMQRLMDSSTEEGAA